MESKMIINSMVEKSRAAQKEFEKSTQEQIDLVVKTVAKVVFDNAEILARMAVDETRMGVYEDKVKKNMGKARIIWNSMIGVKSVGILSADEKTGIVEIAKPKGVVAAITPTTNPIVTPMCNIMFALKGGNSIIIAPHPRSKKCSTYTVDLINEALKKYNVPENLIQIISEPSIDLTNDLMKSADVVVATGGMNMVKAAYSSGKPAYGVGQGNVQCIIDKGYDYKQAVPKIILGRTFDNGIICSGEQTVIAHEDDYGDVISEFVKQGAYYTEDPDEVQKLRESLFKDGIISRDLVGQSVEKVAQTAGIHIPEGTKVILAKADGKGEEDLLAHEKMCPVIAAYNYKTLEEAVGIAQVNLNEEGKGHSASIHSDNEDNIRYAGERLTVSRLVVNQPAATTLGGSFNNGFAPTTTLGCGSWGNNSISENFTYKHLINISRIGHYMQEAKVPSDEELWG